MRVSRGVGHCHKGGEKKMTKRITDQEQELAVLRKIVDLSASDLDLKGLLKKIIGMVSELTEADSAVIYLFDEQRQTLSLMATKLPHKKAIGSVVLKVGEGITGWVAQKNKIVAIPAHAYEDSRFKCFDILPEDKYEAFLSVPMIFRGRVNGVINVQHRQAHVYPKEVINLLELVAKQVGGMVEQTRLYEESQVKARQFDQLMRVSHSITSEKYLDEILSLIVVVTAEMFNSKICSVMILDDKKGDELILKATQSLSEEYKKKPNLKVNNSLAGDVVKTRRPVAVSDVRKEQRYFYRELAVKEGLVAMLAVPMVVKDKAIGVINVYTTEPHDFTEEEKEVLQMVANQAAVAVENTKLMEESLKAKEALETRKLIERAKGILMRMNNLSEEAAHRLIHKKAMDTCRSMKEIAESIILMDEFRK